MQKLDSSCCIRITASPQFRDKATPQNAAKIRNPSHGDVMLPVTVHLPNVKTGCQKLRGQKKIEMKYWTQLWSDVRLLGVDGIWGGAVLWKTPIRM
jgi:hypothetical protein